MATIDSTIGIAGLDCRIDEDGISHPWRMAVWRSIRDGDMIVHRLGSLPDGLRWISIPRDPVHGDLLAIRSPPLVTQTAEMAGELLSVGITQIVVADETAATAVYAGLRRHGITIREVEGHVESCIPSRSDGIAVYFPGEAGREIAIIRKMTEIPK